MHLKFDSIEITRFRSFLSKTVLEFDSVGPGVYFLKGKNNKDALLGSNGAGKSTIIDALLWCLYGKTVQGLKNPDIIPWSGKGTTEVVVNITIDRTVHSIRRTAGPNLLSIDMEEAGQEYVDRLIGVPFEILPYTIILGQRQPLFFDLVKSEKLKLFSEVLNLDRWEERSAKAADLTKVLEREIAAKQSELESSLNAQSQAIADFNSLKQQSSAWEEQRAERLSNAESEIKSLKKQIAAVMVERDTADLQLDRAETELKASKLETFLKDYNTARVRIAGFEQDLKSAVKDKARFDAELVSVEECICPTCQQETNKELTKKLRAELTKKIKGCDAVISEASQEVDSFKLIRDQALEKYNIEEAATKKFKDDANEARNVLDRLLPKIANWEAQIKSLEKQLQANETDSNPYTDQLQTLRRRRDQHKVSIKQAEDFIKEKTEHFERVKYWVKGFKDIKLLQVEEVLQELEITTNSMCEESGLVGWQVKYDIERETKSGTISRGLNITVLSPSNDKAVKWEAWSGGEAQRLRLIGTAALSSVLLNHAGVTTNLEVYDEPTIGLSREGIQDLVELLAQRAKQTKKNIWLVDHHAMESSHFVETILVTKEKKSGSMLSIV